MSIEVSHEQDKNIFQSHATLCENVFLTVSLYGGIIFMRRIRCEFHSTNICLNVNRFTWELRKSSPIFEIITGLFPFSTLY